MKEEQNRNGLPKGWKWESFGNVVNNFDGKRKPLSRQIRSTRRGEYRYYGATEIVDYIDDFIYEGEYLLIGEDGANLLSKSRPLAFIVDGRFWVNNHAHVLQAKETAIDKYLCYYFNSLNLGDYVTGTAQPKLTQANLNKIPVPICGTTIQKAIVSKIEELFSELDKGIENLRLAQQQLKIYRQAVLKWAFEGKLTNENVKEGELLEEWKWAKLGDVCLKIQDGSHFSPQVQYDEPGENRFKYITAKNIRNNFMDFRKVIYVDKSFHSSIYGRCNPEFGDVLLTKDGVNTGEVTLNTLKEEISLLSSVCLFKTKSEKLNSAFLKYYIQSPIGNRNILGEMSGTAIKRIILKKIKDSEIIIPPIGEQFKIVGEIENRLSVADKMEETINQSLKHTEVLRNSLLKKAFAGQLVEN